MTIVSEKPWTIEGFLSWEDRQEGRHEFDRSRVIPMTGASRARQRIVLNLMRLLEDRLAPDAFDAVHAMRFVMDGKIRYPDVAVCAGRIDDAVRTPRDAVVVFEILSAESEDRDREEKRDDSAKLPGIRRYVLLEQVRMGATILTMAAGAWSTAGATAGSVAFPEIGVEMTLEELYRGVRFPRASG